ncbi:MAG: hypothetical protein KAJ18_08560 [Candidatus Omnitrophica bacterium]|nr:hypothetical protein [Candidatus Omnitrophota bacterium]
MTHIQKNRFIQTIILILGIIYIGYTAPNSWALAIVKSKVINHTKNIDIREGDFIFQHLPGKLLRIISDVTQSQYSHCGIIVKKNNKFYVLEAIGPVKETPLNQWISYGIKDQFTIVRLKKHYQKNIPQIIKAAYQFQGLPYDIQYEWDDQKIYCSELIYKAAKRGAGIELANFKRLGELNWQPHQDFIRYIANGELPLNRAMITPEDVAFSEKVHVVYSSFPAKTSANIYTRNDLDGRWQGNYTLTNILLSARAKVEQIGTIQSGQLESGLSFTPTSIKRFNPATGEFKYVVYSANQIKITIHGRVDHTKDGIYGKWRDGLGFNGTFHLTKKTKPTKQMYINKI